MAKQTFTTGSVLTATQMNNLQANDYNWTVSQKTASYVLAAADVGTRIEMNAAGSTTVTVNTGLFTAGDSVIIQNVGAGTCTVTAGTATVNKAANASLALAQYQGGTLYFVSASSAIFFPFDVGTAVSSTAVGCSLSNSADWSISSSVDTALTFDTEIFDTDNFHSTSSNTSRITIPSGKAGKYIVSSLTVFAANATGYRAPRIKKNGNIVAPQQSSWTLSGSLSTYMWFTVVLDLAVADYIELFVLQNSGGALNVQAVPSYTSHFSAMYLGA